MGTKNESQGGEALAKEKFSAGGCLKDTPAPTICQENIPQEIRELPQWILWKSKPKGNGKTTKIPYSVAGGMAKSDSPKTWATYQDALSRYKTGKYDGIGLVFSQDDPNSGIDLDHCRDPRTGKIEPWALEIIKAFHSYCEISPSGTGVHIICKGKLPEGGRKKDNIEIYDKGRYFTVTGNHLDGTPTNIRPAQDAINRLLASHFTKEKPPQAPRPSVSQQPCESDSELIQKAIESRNGHKFNLLYQGQWENAGYLSQSEADQAFCNLLAFWTGRDAARIDNIFRQSGLMRPKWDKKHYGDGRTYGQVTIEKAISGCSETYSARRNTTFDRCSDTDETVFGNTETGIGLSDNGQKVSKLSPITIPDIQRPAAGHHSEARGPGQVALQNLWEEPVLLDDFSLPEMEAVPGIIGEFSQAVSAATETPLELAMGMCLATVATACQKKFIVQVKPGYSEPLNIYVNALLNSGERKTSVHTEMTRPSATWEKQQRFEMEPLVKEAEIQRKNQEARIKSLRARYGKAKRDELNEIEDDIRELESKLVEAPVMPKIWVQDITPEHLGTVMSLHNEKIAILSAEGGIFDIMAGRYSRGIPNLDLFLQGHSGDPVRVDRGSRDSIYLEHPALTMGLSTQPEVLQSIADAPGFRGRGLLARFLYLFPKSRLGHRTLETEPVPQHVKEEYESLIHTLLNIEPPTDEHGNNVPYSLHLKRSAYKEWLEFSRVVEKDLLEGGRFENITDWAGKLPGATARIAGLLHCVKHPQQAWSDQISLESMQQALGLGAIFSCHALKAFNFMGADKSLEGAKKAWRWVERGKFKSFRKNNIYNALKGTFPRVADIKPCLDVLEERNYISPLKEKKVGRPSITYAVNPNFCERWA